VCAAAAVAAAGRFGYADSVSVYLPVALALEGARVLVLGGDLEAADKAARLAKAGARVTVFAETVIPALSALARCGALQWHARTYEPRDARGVRAVVLAPRDEELAKQLRSQARRDGFLFSAIDQPAYCDFVWTSVVEAGRVQLSMSSGGAAPALLKRLRIELERVFDARFAAFTERVALARDRLTASTLEARRAEMAVLLDGFALEARLVYPSWEAAGHGEERRVVVDPTP